MVVVGGFSLLGFWFFLVDADVIETMGVMTKLFGLIAEGFGIFNADSCFEAGFSMDSKFRFPVSITAG